MKLYRSPTVSEKAFKHGDKNINSATDMWSITQ